MANMIVSANRIKSRRYDLIIDGKIVEEYLSSKMAKRYRDEYRAEGFAVDMVESFSVTKANKIIGENPVQEMPDANPNKKLLTPSATDQKIKLDRERMRVRNEGLAAKNNRQSTSIRYTGYGEEENSILHEMRIEAIRKNGYEVTNKITGEIWIGLQREIAERIFQYLNYGGSRANLDIKFLGKEN